MIHILVEQNSEAWYEHRIGRITASNFATAMSGMNTKGFNDLLSTCALEIITGEIEEKYTSADMVRGHEQEPDASMDYEHVFGVKLNQMGFCIPDESDPLHDWIGVSPDREVDGERGLVEIKTAKRLIQWERIKKGVLPSEHKWQVQGQLFVTGYDYCDFVSYSPNMKLFVVRVYPDLEMHKELRDRLELIVPMVKAQIEMYHDFDTIMEMRRAV